MNTHDDGEDPDIEGRETGEESPASAKAVEAGEAEAAAPGGKASAFWKAMYYWALSRR